MPLLADPKRIRKILKKLETKKIAVPCFGTENTYTVEGILIGTARIAKALGIDAAPVFIAATANYTGRTQLSNYTSLESTKEGYLAFRADMERLCRDEGPFENVLAIPSLDHGQYDTDEFLFEDGKDFWGCVMYDCSKLPLDENRKKAAEFVKKYKNTYVIEGCVDYIYDSGSSPIEQLTKPDQAELFLKETNVDLMVANLGTEHRATKADLRYHSDLAKKISQSVGYKLVLHGTSSLAEKDLRLLRYDGIAKVNIWTILETDPAQKMAEAFIKNIGKIFHKDKVRELFEQGWLGKKAMEHAESYKPSLANLTEVYRRNDIKVPAVAELTKMYFDAFGYGEIKNIGKL